MIHSNLEPLIQMDTGGNITAANSQIESLTGQRRETLLGSPFQELFTNRSLGLRVVEEVYRKGQLNNWELTLLAAYGREAVVAVRAYAVAGADGAVTGAIVVIQDIEEQPRAEEQFRALLEAAPDAMVIVDPGGQIVLVNAQTERLFGFTRDELLNKSVEILLPHRYRNRHPAHRNQYFSEPRLRHMGEGLDLWALHRDGSEFPVEISLSPLRTQRGMLVSASIRDITERKRFEQTLQEKNVELERANQAKDRFLASVSHELRTPLNAIIGFTGTLLMRLPGPLTNDQDKQLRIVQSSARHLLSLINDLLDLAKIQSGNVELNPEPVNCNEVADEVASALRSIAGPKGIRIEVKLPAEPLIIRTDKRALRQILLNLANNAVKFTVEGSVTIEIDPAGGSEDGILFRIIDTGIGIRPEDQTKLFQAFSRLEDSFQGRSFEGTGLGLHISQKLAELLSGRITFESEPGKGSIFCLTLPRG